MSISLLPRVVSLTARRLVCSSSIRYEIFTVQDEEDFRSKVINNKKPVLVDFFATWCNPCKQLTPRLETVVGAKAGKIDLAKVDVDTHEDLAAQYKVSSVPTILAVKNGKVADSFVGNIDDDQLRAFIEKLDN